MPFFYSQYLKDDKRAWAAREVAHLPSGAIKQQSPQKKAPDRPDNSTPKHANKHPPLSPKKSPTRPAEPSRLVWHSNIGSTQRTRTSRPIKSKGGLFSAFQSKKKTVHFATIEVQPFRADYSCDPDVYFRKDEITAMNKQRFTDASKLRKQRNVKVPTKEEKEKALDDADIAKRADDIDKFLTEAFDPDLDIDEEVSIRGIEHFVYPQLQQEMIRRKKQAKREVINHQKSGKKRLDPTGYKLQKISEQYTQWAREVAIEKGMKYCMNQETIFGTEECGISKDELDRSKDELDQLHQLKSSASYMEPSLSRMEATSTTATTTSKHVDLTQDLELVVTKSEISDVTALMSNVYTTSAQPAGTDTRED